MSENASGGESQAGEHANQQQQQEAPKTYTQKEWDDAQGQIKDLRKEAANYRTSAKEFETKLAGYTNGLTADEAKALREDQARLSERLTSAQSRALESDIRATAKELGFTDASDAVALIDRSALKEKEGEVSGVKEALEKLKKDKPHLLGPTGNVDAGARGGVTNKPDMNAMLRGMVRR